MSRVEKVLIFLLAVGGIAYGIGTLAPRIAAANVPLPPLQQEALNQGMTGLTYQHAFGTDTRTGHVTSTGTSATSTISAGVPLLVVCDEWAHVGVRASCSRDITNSAYCKQVKSEREGDPGYYVHPNGSTLAVISADGGTVNCTKFEKR